MNKELPVNQAAEPIPATRRVRSAARVEKREATRAQLLEAAARIVGRYGYSGCTIARITARAKVAHGTFYLHFKSQQELFDTLLPTMGSDMLEAIGHAVRNCHDVIEIERRGFLANFEYLEKHAYLYRLTTEAELYAPRAYREYVDKMIAGYAKSLKRSLQQSGQPALSDRQIELRAAMLTGARMQLLTRYAMQNRIIRHMPDDILGEYLAFVEHGLTHLPTG